VTDTRNLITAVLAVATAVLGFFYYQSRQNVVEIKLPKMTIDRQ